MSIVELVFWPSFLLLALATLVLMLVAGYRTIRQRQSVDYRASQEAKSLMEQGRSYLEQRNFDQAISIYKKAMSLDPNNAQIHSMCGFTRAWQGEHRAAIKDYDRALEINPSDAATHTNRGLSYQQLGNAEMALTDFDQAVSLSPDDPIIRLNRLKLHQALGNTETALADLEHIMEVSPELAEKELTKNLLSELGESRSQPEE